jgi:hypothetical protein
MDQYFGVELLKDAWGKPQNVRQIFPREKYKINSCGLSDLQIAPYGIKIKSEVPQVCQKNNLLSTVIFRVLI